MTGRIPTRVLLVRHGQSTWNADGRWQGQADPPLSALGEQQAREAAARLRDVDALWASDLDRARRTATILGDALGLGVRVDARLRERHAGPWQGLTREQIEAEWPGHLTTNRRPADYETNEAVLARALAALDDIAGLHDGASVVVVTHGGVVRVIERHLGDDTSAPIPNLSGRHLTRVGEGWALGGRVLLVDESSVTVPRQL